MTQAAPVSAHVARATSQVQPYWRVTRRAASTHQARLPRGVRLVLDQEDDEEGLVQRVARGPRRVAAPLEEGHHGVLLLRPGAGPALGADDRPVLLDEHPPALAVGVQPPALAHAAARMCEAHDQGADIHVRGSRRSWVACEPDAAELARDDDAELEPHLVRQLGELGDALSQPLQHLQPPHARARMRPQGRGLRPVVACAARLTSAGRTRRTLARAVHFLHSSGGSSAPKATAMLAASRGSSVSVSRANAARPLAASLTRSRCVPRDERGVGAGSERGWQCLRQKMWGRRAAAGLEPRSRLPVRELAELRAPAEGPGALGVEHADVPVAQNRPQRPLDGNHGAPRRPARGRAGKNWLDRGTAVHSARGRSRGRSRIDPEVTNVTKQLHSLDAAVRDPHGRGLREILRQPQHARVQHLRCVHGTTRF